MRPLGAFRSFLYGYAERVATPAISGGALTLDLSKANVFAVARNGDMTTLTISNVPIGAASFTLRLTTDGAVHAWTWPASVNWGSLGEPVLSTSGTQRDWISFVTLNGGTTCDAFVSGLSF